MNKFDKKILIYLLPHLFLYGGLGYFLNNFKAMCDCLWDNYSSIIIVLSVMMLLCLSFLHINYSVKKGKRIIGLLYFEYLILGLLMQIPIIIILFILLSAIG
jgi:hypothetical protein